MRARDSGCVALREECRGGGGSYGGGPGRVTLAVGHPGTPVPTQPRAAGGPRSPGPGARAPPVVLRAPAWGAQGASWRGGGVGRSGRRGEGSWRGGAARGARARGGSGGATFPGDPGRGFRTGGTTRRAPSPRLASGESPWDQGGGECRHIGYSPVGSGAWAGDLDGHLPGAGVGGALHGG